MSDGLRAPGNPGGTRGTNNPAPVSKPLASSNTDASAPAGVIAKPQIARPGGANNKTAH